MKVNIRHVPSEGMDVEEVLAPEELELEGDDFEFDSPLTVQAHIEKADEVLIADVQVSGRYTFSCSRCLEPFKQERCDRFKLYLDITPKTHVVDLDEDIRQEMVVAVGPVALCRPDCQGICPNCGVNRNEASCSCPRDDSAPARLELGG